MIRGLVKYKDLGRSNAKGTFKVETNNKKEFNEIMFKEFSKHLASSVISFENGKIFAGFHCVGTFEFIAQEGIK